MRKREEDYHVNVEGPVWLDLFSFISRGQSILNASRTGKEGHEQRGYRRYRGGKASPLYKRKTEETTKLSHARCIANDSFLKPVSPLLTPLLNLSQIPFGPRDETALSTPTPSFLPLFLFLCGFSLVEEKLSKRIPLEI